MNRHAMRCVCPMKQNCHLRRVILGGHRNVRARRVRSILVSQTVRILPMLAGYRYPMFRLIRHIPKIENLIVWIVVREQLIHRNQFIHMLRYVIIKEAAQLGGFFTLIFQMHQRPAFREPRNV